MSYALPPITDSTAADPLSSHAQVDVALCFQTYAYREQTRRDLEERSVLRDEEGVAGAESLLRAARHESA